MTAPRCLDCPACAAADIVVLDRVKMRAPLFHHAPLLVVAVEGGRPRFVAGDLYAHAMYRVRNDDGRAWLIAACALEKVP